MDQSDDETAILSVINANRIAVWTQDFAAYEKCFVHADYTTRWNASRFTGISVRQDWADIAVRVKRMFEDPTLYNLANAYDTKIENLRLQVRGDMAWATFDQRYPNNIPDNSLTPSGVIREVRVLERHGGKWLIAFWGVLEQGVGARTAAIRLDPLGTVVSISPEAAIALETDDDLVIRGGRLRIRDSRADAKLQAAIRWAATVDAGIISERGALPIVLEAGEGLPTKVWWVIAEDGLIVFTLGERGFNERRLDVAAIVFGLSAAQKRLAAHVAEGLSLNEIASEMKITPNTARTHLNRVFEKTGVRTQPALVRVLLTAAAPR